MNKILLLNCVLRLKSVLLLNSVLLLFLLLPRCGFATVYTVNNTTDGMATNQLRGALAAIDASGGANTINLSAGTYVLSSEIIFGGVAGENITINGVAGSTIIKNSSDRIFIINTTAAIANLTVTISGVTFSGGFLSTDNYGGGAVLCGGPGNVTSFQNCLFTGNSINSGAVGQCHGGAIAQEGGGALSLNGCSFTGNSCSNGTSGAIFYFQPNTNAGSLSVTNCTFTNNSTTEPSGSTAGAIFVDIQGTTLSTAVSITGNTFTKNSAGTAGYGGAIDVDNGSTATVNINYNRFQGNTGIFPDVSVNPSTGTVNVTNNWWGSNQSPTSATDPHVGFAATGGTGLTASPWLELTCSGSASSLCDGSGGNATTVTAGFATNSAGNTISTGNLGALVGVPISFSSPQGTISTAQTAIQSNGIATATFTDNGVAGTANVQPVVDSVTTTDAVADGKITVNAPSALAAAAASTTFTVGGGAPLTDGNCGEICGVVASGASPVSGSVTAGVTLDGSVQSVDGQPYVTRHYDITPAAGASTATATITLYFLQSEFNAYNALVTSSALKLPTSSSDVTGRGNLTITQYHGSGTAPGNYSGWTGPGPASVLISPGSSNVIWNNAMSWWEVSFPVTGFSGFYVTGAISTPLPVVFERFSGVAQGTGVLLSWQVGVESGVLRYEVEGSTDGVVYTTLGDVLASGAAAYHYFVADPAVGANYYRLKLVNTDGSFSYSTVVVVNIPVGTSGVQVLSNPFTTSCTIRVTAAAGGPVALRLTDISGKTLWHCQSTLSAGVNTFALPLAGELARGLYLLTVSGGRVQETVKVVKE
jgi:hypothetical protein